MLVVEVSHHSADERAAAAGYDSEAGTLTVSIWTDHASIVYVKGFFSP